MVDTRLMLKDFGRIALLLVLLLGLLFALTWTGVVKCKSIPAWCSVYYAIAGKPKVLIVYGTEGLGNPEQLQFDLGNPERLGVRAEMLPLRSVNLGNLKQYALVIVDRAKQISTDKLAVFMQYVDGGGRLVWTGDAGTELTSEDSALYDDEIEAGKPHKLVGVWARKDGDQIVDFGEFISAKYEMNYCDVKTCFGGKRAFAGNLVPISRDHPLVFGIASNLPLYVFEKEDFAIVKPLSAKVSTVIMEINYDTELYTKDENGQQIALGESTPLIITSGFGEKIAYYSMPPELLANPKLEDKYYSFLENMYYGMLEG